MGANNHPTVIPTNLKENRMAQWRKFFEESLEEETNDSSSE